MTFPKMPQDLPHSGGGPSPNALETFPVMPGPYHPEPPPVILSIAKDLREAAPIAGSGRQPGTLNVCTPYPLERVMRLHQ